MKPLDIINAESWPEDVVQLMTDMLNPLSQDEAAVNAISAAIDSFDNSNERIRLVVSKTRSTLIQIPNFVAYHTCRPLRIESYMQRGLRVRTDERLFDLAQEYAGGISGWEDAFDAVLSQYNAPGCCEWYNNTVGLSFIPFESYATRGSYFLCDLFAQLGEAGAKRRKEILDKTKPTVLVCTLSLNWILGTETDGDLLDDYVAELLLSVIAHAYGQKRGSENSRAIHLCVDLPPENIIDIRLG